MTQYVMSMNVHPLPVLIPFPRFCSSDRVTRVMEEDGHTVYLDSLFIAINKNQKEKKHINKRLTKKKKKRFIRCTWLSSSVSAGWILSY